MTTKQQSSQRRVHSASTVITLAVVVLFGCSQKALAQQHNLTRTLPTTVNNEVDIGDFAFTNGAGSLWISVTVPSSGYSVAKEYLLPIQHDQNANVWQTALPAASTGSYNGNDFALDIKVNQGTASLRLRTTASSGGNVGTAYIVIKQEGANDTFTGSTTTSAVSAPTAFFGSTALTQVGGNVGIGTASPGQILHLSSAATSGTGLRIDNTDTGGRGFRLLSTGTGNSSGAGRFHLLDETSAASRLTVDSSGNVGIGTASPVFDGNPARYLTVDAGPGVLGSIGAAGGTTNLNYPVSQVAFINSNLGTPEKRLATIVGGTDTVTNSGVLDFFTASAGAFTLPPRLRINSSGNVGIGTSSPTTRLDVAGQIRSSTGGFKFPDGTVQTTAAGSGAVSSVFGRTGAVVAANNDYTWAQINKSTSSLADITTRSASDLSSGTLPDARFPAILPTVSGANLTTLNASNLTSGIVPLARLGSGTANSTTFLRGDNTWAEVPGGPSQWTSGTNSISYNSGNVGIGAANPANAKLHIFSGASGASEYTAGGFPELTLESGQNTDLYFLSPNTGSARIWFGSPASNTAGGIMYFHNATPANGYMFFSAGNNSEKMRILGNGNIGIGTIAPASKLEVAGTIHSTAGGFKFPDGSVQTTAASGSGGSSAFSGITAGTNTAALLVGTGGSLGVSGSGTINATTLGGATFAAPGAIGGTTRGSGAFTAVGINTTPSSYKLDVNGNTNITGNITVAGTGNITAAGTIEGGNIKAKYQDLAEWVPSREQLTAGTVVVLDTTKSNQVISSNATYDTRVAGVISAQPGITLGEGGEGKVLVATTGRVRVKVDASRGAIQIGDLLVTSDVLGVAMKSEAVEFAGRKMHMPGTIIGKALEPLAKGSGEILVLLSLQ